ncbi:uncharacterized protein LOC112342439 isoform X1 [Selaginella moellendorffii]|uniref:uncharacterized protein LOC112342439 isoform X1 n=1 Tax=Selaginella moellendorffii TaxID=88036 RepID=UPI000D1CC4E1|nr:uncharacterized protein LOC112342439 isoform X1 [Selaginella moellendorffii]|eukprot:XP_024520016.1 uncharacterized protein LOC112342439 isoform X1 [Selaginella moellendorffii]
MRKAHRCELFSFSFPYFFLTDKDSESGSYFKTDESILVTIVLLEKALRDLGHENYDRFEIHCNYRLSVYVLRSSLARKEGDNAKCRVKGALINLASALIHFQGGEEEEEHIDWF